MEEQLLSLSPHSLRPLRILPDRRKRVMSE